MSRQPSRARRGFTIIEVIVIVVILGVLAAVIVPRLLGRIGESKQAVARSNAASLVSNLKMFEIDCGALRPGTTIDVLWSRPADADEGKWKGPYIDNADALNDPWGNKYILLIPSQNGNADWDIVSYGADGQHGGEDEDADIVKP